MAEPRTHRTIKHVPMHLNITFCVSLTKSQSIILCNVSSKHSSRRCCCSSSLSYPEQIDKWQHYTAENPFSHVKSRQRQAKVFKVKEKTVANRT